MTNVHPLRTVRLVCAVLTALVMLAAGVVVPSAASATPAYNVIVDFGTPKAAGILVCVRVGTQGCGESFTVDATGVGRTNLGVGTWALCITDSDYLVGWCTGDAATSPTIRVTSTETATTFRFTLRDKETDPVSASIGPMTWSTGKKPYAWAYGWSYTLDYAFATTIRSPWVHARIRAQSGDTLVDFGRKSVARGSGSSTFGAGGGSATACGFVHVESTNRTVAVSSLTLEVVVPVVGGTRTYRSRATTSLAGCKKPLALTFDSIRVSGARVGKKATASFVTWPGVTSTYQWYVGDKKVTGATKKTFKVPASAASKNVLVRVTSRGSGYRTARESGSALVKKGILPALPAPVVKGTARVGHTLRASVHKPVKSATYRLQWYANGKKITGATSSRLKLTIAHKGKRISVTETASKRGYTTKKVASKKTAAVKR